MRKRDLGIPLDISLYMIHGRGAFKESIFLFPDGLREEVSLESFRK